jgi:hypothetical protein
MIKTLPFIINQSFLHDQRLTPACRQGQRSTTSEKESPDVETPGLLVKALISSYFKKNCFLSSLSANITA